MSSDPIYYNLNIEPLFQLACSSWPSLLSMSLLSEADDLMQCARNGEEAPSLDQLKRDCELFSEPKVDAGQCIVYCDDCNYLLHRLSNDSDTVIGTLILAFQANTEIKAEAAELKAFCGILLNDYQLNSELDSAAVELSDRYEELNLIYGKEENTEQFDQGYSALLNLVCQCAERMNVSSTMLLLPEQDIFIIEEDEAANMAHLSVEHLARDVLMPWVSANSDTIIVNDEFDSELEKACPDLLQKMLLAPVYGYDNSVCGFISVFNSCGRDDFTNSDRNLLQIMSRKAARVVRSNFDGLTGLANRSSFEALLEQQLRQSSKNEDAALLLIDISGVHIINESASAEAGDALIRNAAKLISAQFPDQALVARLGGDIFAVAFRELSVDQAHRNARILLSAINAMNFEWQGTSFHVNASMSIVPLDPELSCEELIGTGKIAIQLAREKGNNMIEIQRPNNKAIAQRKERMRTLNTLQDALECDYFELFCQGIYSVADTETPHHYEILLRLHSEETGFVPPDMFLPAAEYYKLMPDIDRWVIRNTLQTLSTAWGFLEHATQSWAINLSGQTFAQHDLPDYIAAQLYEFKLPAEKIAFEVTETVAVDDLSAARATIEKIQALGCEFYLDDFGTGLSSFTYLQQLPFDHVKIDGSFVKNVVEDEVAQAMVKAIADVAHVLGMKTVAEYVENEQIIATLKTLGVEFLQGYGLHKPTALGEVISQLDVLKIKASA